MSALPDWRSWKPSGTQGLEEVEDIAATAIGKASQCVQRCEAAQKVAENGDIDRAQQLLKEAAKLEKEAQRELDKAKWRKAASGN